MRFTALTWKTAEKCGNAFSSPFLLRSSPSLPRSRRPTNSSRGYRKFEPTPSLERFFKGTSKSNCKAAKLHPLPRSSIRRDGPIIESGFTHLCLTPKTRTKSSHLLRYALFFESFEILCRLSFAYCSLGMWIPIGGSLSTSIPTPALPPPCRSTTFFESNSSPRTLFVYTKSCSNSHLRRPKPRLWHKI